YPEHEVSVASTNPQIFLKIQQGIIDHVSSNQFLQAINAVSQESNTTETNLLLASISGLDSLRQAYNKRLAFGGETNDFRWGNISFEHNKMQITAPELELYDKMLQLKDELRAIKNKSAHQNKILQVYVPFNPI